MRFRLLALVASATFLLAGCGGGGKTATTTTAPPIKPVVVATTTQIGDFARIIGGDKIDLKVIGRAGADPHTVVPSPNDITALATARVILRNGAGLEGWFDQAFDESESTAVVSDMSDGIRTRSEQVNGVASIDPHIWMSVVNARIMVANAQAALIAADPANQLVYEANSRAYSAQLTALADEVEQLMTRVQGKMLVTSHTSVGYFIDEFGLVDGGSVNSSLKASDIPTQARAQQLASYYKQQGVTAIFSESTVNGSAGTAIASAIGARYVDGNQQLYVDALGPQGSDAETYLKMMRHNANSIANNLG